MPGFDSATSLLWTSLLAGVLVLTALMKAADLTIDPASPGNIPYLICGAVALGLRQFGARLPWRHGPALADAAEYYATFTLIALVGAVASYPIAGLSHGFHDAALQRIDVALGFDWGTWYRTVADHPWMQLLGLAAYRSIYLTPALLLAHAAGTADRGAAIRFLAIFWLTAVATLTLYAFMPAVGPFSYLWHGATTYMPDSERWQQGLIPALRSHEVRVIDLANLRGLVSAPSFHTAAAVIYIHAAWTIPRLRWPILAINIAMLLSTPVEGTHYLTDMLLGAAVAGTAIWAIGKGMAVAGGPGHRRFTAG